MQLLCQLKSVKCASRINKSFLSKPNNKKNIKNSWFYLQVSALQLYKIFFNFKLTIWIMCIEFLFEIHWRNKMKNNKNNKNFFMWRPKSSIKCFFFFLLLNHLRSQTLCQSSLYILFFILFGLPVWLKLCSFIQLQPCFWTVFIQIYSLFYIFHFYLSFSLFLTYLFHSFSEISFAKILCFVIAVTWG